MCKTCHAVCNNCPWQPCNLHTGSHGFAFTAHGSENAALHFKQGGIMNSLTVNAGVALFALGLAGVAHAAKLEETAPYPKAESGFTRQVIHLAPQTREDDFQVEILAGKTMTADCN